MKEGTTTNTLTCSRHEPGKCWPGFRAFCRCPSETSSSTSPRCCTLAPCWSTSKQPGNATRFPARSCPSSVATGSWSGVDSRAGGPRRPCSTDDRLETNSFGCPCPGRRKGGGGIHGWAGWDAWLAVSRQKEGPHPLVARGLLESGNNEPTACIVWPRYMMPPQAHAGGLHI